MSFLAVDFFFCLSGFALSHAYGERLAGRALSHGAFLRLRVQRLYPMIVLGTLIGTAIHLAIADFPRAQVLITAPATLLLLPLGILFHRDAYPVDNPLWSLFFEFAGGIALGLLAGARTWAWVALAALGALGIAALLAMGADFDALGFTSAKMFIGGFARLLLPFAAGIALHRGLGGCRRTIGPIWAFAALGLLLFVYDSGSLPGILFAVAVCVPAIVALGALARPGAGDGAFRLAGRLSYPVYVLHLPLIDAAGWAAGASPAASPLRLSLLAAAIALTLALSAIAERLWERPARAWLGRALRTRPA
jgi:peptidoglycan/LPS O-acetylase OafA/YrhL